MPTYFYTCVDLTGLINAEIKRRKYDYLQRKTANDFLE